MNINRNIIIINHLQPSVMLGASPLLPGFNPQLSPKCVGTPRLVCSWRELSSAVVAHDVDVGGAWTCHLNGPHVAKGRIRAGDQRYSGEEAGILRP
jgi:hypothetical protein